MHGNIVFIGPPGSGKGTQIEKLKKYDFTVLALGQILREHVANDTIYKPLIESYMRSGHMVPDDITFKLTEELINKRRPGTSLLFDGLPRTIEQDHLLTALLKKYNEQIDRVIFLDVPKDILIQRIKQRAIYGRIDDQDDEKIATRMHTYQERTLPLIEYYQNKYPIHRIDGSRSIEEIGQEIKELLDLP